VFRGQFLSNHYPERNDNLATAYPRPSVSLEAKGYDESFLDHDPQGGVSELKKGRVMVEIKAREAIAQRSRAVPERSVAQYCSVVPAMCQFTAAQERIIAETAMAD
jgi:hypothetical protein